MEIKFKAGDIVQYDMKCNKRGKYRIVSRIVTGEYEKNTHVELYIMRNIKYLSDAELDIALENEIIKVKE